MMHAMRCTRLKASICQTGCAGLQPYPLSVSCACYHYRRQCISAAYQLALVVSVSWLFVHMPAACALSIHRQTTPNTCLPYSNSVQPDACLLVTPPLHSHPAVQVLCDMLAARVQAAGARVVRLPHPLGQEGAGASLHGPQALIGQRARCRSHPQATRILMQPRIGRPARRPRAGAAGSAARPPQA